MFSSLDGREHTAQRKRKKMGRIGHESDIDDDTPLRLQEACDLFFGGRLTPKALRAEARKGNLVIERIANKDFVTPVAIRDMRVKCRVPASTKAAAAQSRDAGSRPASYPSTAAQDALRLKLDELRRDRKKKPRV